MKSDEKQLLIQLSQSDHYAFEKLFNHYKKHVYKASRRLIKSHVLAQEVVQEVFTVLWEKRKTMTGVHNLSAYLIWTTKNTTLTMMTKAINQFKREENFFKDLMADDQVITDREDHYRNILIVISMLPPMQKKVFELAKLEGLSYDEISKLLNISTHTVRVHINRAFKFLRNHFNMT